MKNKIVFFTVFALVVLSIVGCGSSPTATPAPTQPPVIVTVIITPTPLPPTATVAVPTITPIPTAAVTTTVSAAASPTVNAATKSTTVASAPTNTRAAVVRTATPKPPAVTATNTALPIKYPAPTLFKPLWNDTQKDEVKFPGSAMVYGWRPIGGLAGDECYLLTATSEAVNNPALSPRTDTFVVGCGDATPTDAQNGFQFTLYQPGRGGPSYSSLMMDSSEMWVYWTVTVVKNLGSCADQFHCKTAPLSPASNRGKFLFKGS